MTEVLTSYQEPTPEQSESFGARFDNFCQNMTDFRLAEYAINIAHANNEPYLNDKYNSIHKISEAILTSIPTLKEALTREDDTFAKGIKQAIYMAYNSKNIPMKEIGFELLSSYIEVIDKKINDEDPVDYDNSDLIESMICLLQSGDTEDQVKAMSVLNKHYPLISKALVSEARGDYFRAVEPFFTSPNSEHRQDMRDLLMKNLYNNQDRALQYYFTTILGDLYGSSHLEASLEAELMVIELLNTLSLDPNIFIPLWKRSSQERNINLAITDNIQTVLGLESNSPGTCNALYTKYGIADFGRYPAKLLEKQIDEEDDTDTPYGIIIYPRDDYNGAFYNKNGLLPLTYQFEDEMLVRIVECESKWDIGRILLNFDQKYGDKNKISFAIIGGHGTENSISFGGDDERHTLKTSDFTDPNTENSQAHPGKGIRRSYQFFTQNPTIILVSCSTGAKQGIGKELSIALNALVIAPDIPTNIERISVEMHQKKPIFDVEYTDKDSAKIFASGAQYEKPQIVDLEQL